MSTSGRLRILTGIVIAFITVANLFAAARLIADILTSSKIFANNPIGLLAVGGVVWATNVIAFGLWYGDLDRGGAAARAHQPLRGPAFVLPGDDAHRVHASRLGATICRLPVAGLLGRHRVQPHRHLRDQPWAKLVMIMEASVSLGLGALVIARAVKILKT